jgi:hypothetical protein
LQRKIPLTPLYHVVEITVFAACIGYAVFLITAAV